MADEKKEPWLNYLALATVILAVCATLSTFKGGSYSTRSVLSQSQAANQWAYYQSKSIKGYLYEIQKEALETDLQQTGASLSPEVLQEMKSKLDSYTKRIARYDAEKAEIMKDAKKFEEVRDDAQRHSQIFGIAVIFLQIAILLSSIAALLKKKIIWFLGLAVGTAGVVYFANGFFLFFD
ncbi:MAG: DUF4337 domain-containing protein [Syntrophobacteraceae bacterium]